MPRRGEESSPDVNTFTSTLTSANSLGWGRNNEQRPPAVGFFPSLLLSGRGFVAVRGQVEGDPLALPPGAPAIWSSFSALAVDPRPAQLGPG